MRDSARVARSEFHRGIAADHFDAVRDRFVGLAGASDSFLVSHEDLVGNADKILSALCAFIGETYDADRIKGVLADRHGFSQQQPEAFVTDFPFYVRAGARFAESDIRMLYVNRFERGPGSVVIGGFVASSRPGFSAAALRERSGYRVLRFHKQDALMHDRDKTTELPVTNFLVEIECPRTVERLTIVLPSGETLLELNNLRHLGRDLGRRA